MLRMPVAQAGITGAGARRRGKAAGLGDAHADTYRPTFSPNRASFKNL
jgi:hypothetical protein